MKGDLVKPLLTEKPFRADADESVRTLLQIARAYVVINQRKMLFLIGDGPALVVQDISLALRQMLQKGSPRSRAR